MMSSSDVRASTFTSTRFRPGYDTGDVDAFLVRVGGTLESYERRSGGDPELSAVAVVNAGFRPTKFRAGYDQGQVDALLDQIVATLREYEGSGKPTIL